jgi:hypothetical protein
MHTRRTRRAGLGLAVASTFALLATALTAAPASADTQTTKSQTYHQGYNKTTMTRFYSPNICVKTQFQGVINFRANFETWKRSIERDTLYLYFIDNVSLSNNTMTVSTFKPNGSTCTTTSKNYETLKAKLKVRSYSCDMNPSLSVSVPWSVGASFWPDCGDKELAGWSMTDDNGGHSFKMSHTNDVVRFGGSQSTNWSPTKRTGLTWNCGGAAADLTVKTGAGGDTKTSAKIKYCPTWDGTTSWW